MSRSIIVSRHPATIAWLQACLPDVAGVYASLPIDQLLTGDSVYGNLPAQLIADINALGCRYYHVQLTLPEALRGKELDDSVLATLAPEVVGIEARRTGSQGLVWEAETRGTTGHSGAKLVVSPTAKNLEDNESPNSMTQEA